MAHARIEKINKNAARIVSQHFHNFAIIEANFELEKYVLILYLLKRPKRVSTKFRSQANGRTDKHKFE